MSVTWMAPLLTAKMSDAAVLKVSSTALTAMPGYSISKKALMAARATPFEAA